MQQQLKNVVFYAAVTYITQQALHYLVFHNALVQLLARWSAERALDALSLVGALSWQSLVLTALGSAIALIWLVPRLLGLFISKIVLRLITRGFKISVRQVSFLHLQGLQVLVPAAGLCVWIDEIRLATRVQSVACKVRRRKFFMLVIHRPHVEIDLHKLPGCGKSYPNGADIANRPSSERMATGRETPPAPQETSALPRWLEALVQSMQGSLLPPLFQMSLRAVAAMIELVVVDSTVDISMPIMGRLRATLQEVAVCMQRTSICVLHHDQTNRQAAPAKQKRVAFALRVSTQPLHVSHWYALPETTPVTAAAQSSPTAKPRRVVVARTGSGGLTDAGGIGSGGSPSGTQPMPKTLGAEEITEGQNGLILTVKPCVFSGVVALRLSTGVAVQAQVHSVFIDIGHVSVDMQELLLLRMLESQALLSSSSAAKRHGSMAPSSVVWREVEREQAIGRQARATERQRSYLAAPPDLAQMGNRRESGEVEAQKGAGGDLHHVFTALPRHCVFIQRGVVLRVIVVGDGDGDLVEGEVTREAQVTISAMRMKCEKTSRMQALHFVGTYSAVHGEVQRDDESQNYASVSGHHPAVRNARDGLQHGAVQIEGGPDWESVEQTGIGDGVEVFADADSLDIRVGGWYADAGNQTERLSGRETGAVTPLTLSVRENLEDHEINFAEVVNVWCHLAITLPQELLIEQTAGGVAGPMRLALGATDDGGAISVDMGIDRVACDLEPAEESVVLSLAESLSELHQDLQQEMELDQTTNVLLKPKALYTTDDYRIIASSRPDSRDSSWWAPGAGVGGVGARVYGSGFVGYGRLQSVGSRGLGTPQTPYMRHRRGGVAGPSHKRPPFSVQPPDFGVGVARAYGVGVPTDLPQSHGVATFGEKVGNGSTDSGSESEWDRVVVSMLSRMSVNFVVVHCSAAIKLANSTQSCGKLFLTVGVPIAAASTAERLGLGGGVAMDKENALMIQVTDSTMRRRARNNVPVPVSHGSYGSGPDFQESDRGSGYQQGEEGFLHGGEDGGAEREHEAIQLPLTMSMRVNKMAVVLFHGTVEGSQRAEERLEHEDRMGTDRDGSKVSSTAQVSELFSLKTSSFYSHIDVQQMPKGGKQISASISEVVTGEISGANLELDFIAMETLSQLTLPTKMKASDENSQRVGCGQVGKDGGGRVSEGSLTGLPFPIALHFQNVRMSLSAPFVREGDQNQKDGNCPQEENVKLGPSGRGVGRELVGKMMLSLVRGKLEGGDRNDCSFRIDLDANSDSLDGPPAIHFGYAEWSPDDGMEGRKASKIVDHTVFSLQRLYAEATPPHVARDGEGEERPNVAVPEGEESRLVGGGRGGEGRADLKYAGVWSESGAANGDWSSGEEDAEAKGSFGPRWQRAGGDRPFASRRAQGAWGSRKGDRNVKMMSGKIRVVVNGVRLDLQVPMLHSMLEVCLAHERVMRNGASPQRYERNDGSGAGARAKDDFSRPVDPPMNHSFAGPANESKEAGAPAEIMVSVEFHDIWLNFLVTERAMLGLDLHHVILSHSQHTLPHHPVQLRYADEEHERLGVSGEQEGLCAIEVRDFAVHRMHTSGFHAPILTGTLGQETFEADCDSYAVRTLPPGCSDRFFQVQLFRAATSFSSLRNMSRVAETFSALGDDGDWTGGHSAHVEVAGICVSIPMPANISLHGRREGLRGPWAKRREAPTADLCLTSQPRHLLGDSIARWTDLGVMVGDCLLVQKALMVFVENRTRPRPPALKEGGIVLDSLRQGEAEVQADADRKITELPRGMPNVDIQLSDLDVKIVDDSFEVWMSAFYRLHLDEAAERLKREALLKQRLMHLRSTGLVQVSAEAEAQMQKELERLNSLAWQRRAINFKNADLFSSPPPLMHLRVDNLSGLFMPRPATWLENKTADMDLSGLSKGSALWPEFDMLVGGEVSRIVISGVSMRIRDYIEPLFTIKTVEVCGTEDQCVGGTSAVSDTDEGSGRESHHHSNGSQPEKKDAEHGNKKGVGSDATLPPGWRKRGCVIMSEERLPVAAKALRVAVHQKLHPDAAAIEFSRSPAPSKLWAELDVLLDEPKVSHGPALGPAINIISMVVAGLSPPSFNPVGKPKPPPLMSWDQARMMLHGSVRLHMNGACLRLQADPSPHSNAECLQLLGQPVTISYEVFIADPDSKKQSSSSDRQQEKKREEDVEKQSKQISSSLPMSGTMSENKPTTQGFTSCTSGVGRKVGRVHLNAKMIEWKVISKHKEMASYMLLKKPLLEAMKMDVTVSLDWKCQGSPFAHHLTQLIRSCGLPTFSEPVSQPGLPEIDLTDAMSPGDWSLRSCEGTVPGKLARRFSGSRGLKRAVKLTMMAVGAQGLGHEGLSSEMTILGAQGYGNEGLSSEIPVGQHLGVETSPQTPMSAVSAISSDAVAGGLVIDLYKSFRSEALALTVRVSTLAAKSTLHVNTLRWLLAFSHQFERDADPINRYVGSIDKEGKRGKTLNSRSSVSRHIKAVKLMLISKELEVDCFHVGEHRVFTSDAADAKSVVLKFCGDSLFVEMRLQRQPKQLPLFGQEACSHGVKHSVSEGGPAEVELEEIEDATGNWDPIDFTVSLSNLITFAQPSKLSARKAFADVPMNAGHPLFSAGKVDVIGGESLYGELIRAGTQLGLELDPMSPASHKMHDHGDADGEVHSKLLRQHSLLPSQENSKVLRAHSGEKTSAGLIKMIAAGTISMPKGLTHWDMQTLKDIIEDLKESDIIEDRTYRFRVYRSVWTGSDFVDWALTETQCSTRQQAMTLGQTLLDKHLIKSLDLKPTILFEDSGTFYRIVKSKATQDKGVDDDTPTAAWSKAWGFLRPSRMDSSERKCAAVIASRKAMENETDSLDDIGSPHLAVATGPTFKLKTKDVYLQWTAESREILHDWGLLLTLATRPHPPRQHDTVDPAPGLQGLDSQHSGVWESRFFDKTVQPMSEDGLVCATASGGFLDDEDDGNQNTKSRKGFRPVTPNDLPDKDLSNDHRQDGSSLLTNKGGDSGLVQHLLRTAHAPEAATNVSVMQENASMRPHAPTSVPGTDYPPPITTSPARNMAGLHARRSKLGLTIDTNAESQTKADDFYQLPTVKWIIEFESVQLGVEKVEEEMGTKGAERCVLVASSAVMYQLERNIREPNGRMQFYEDLLLQVHALDAFVAMASPENLPPGGPLMAKSMKLGDMKKRWAPTVWKTGDEEDDNKTLRKALSIIHPDNPPHLKGRKVAISFSKSQRVSSLVGGDATEDGTAERGEVGRVQDADVEGDQGSKVAVVLQKVEMRTDTSQIPPIVNCLNDMMTPSATDKQKAQETENWKSYVQMMPEVVKEMNDMKEERKQLVQAIEELQNRYADIERQEVDWQIERQQSKQLLKAQLTDLRSKYTQISNKVNALTEESQKQERNNLIARITIDIDDCVWWILNREWPPASGLKWNDIGSIRPAQGRDITNLAPELTKALKFQNNFTQQEWDSFGIRSLDMDDFIRSADSYFKPAHADRREQPPERPLARVQLKGLTHTQENDIDLGVPVNYNFRLRFFQIESQLEDKWNKDFEKVLAPFIYKKNEDGEDRFDLDDSDFDANDRAMISVTAQQEKQPEGHQMILKYLAVDVHPVRIQITEDLFNCLYAFAFPGEWSMHAGSWDWKHDSSHNISVTASTGHMVTVEQKREFYRLPVTRCRPHPAAHGSVRQPLQHCPSDQPAYPPNESGSVVVAGRVGGGKGDAGPGIMVEEHRFRARDHIEFREVTIGTDEGLVVDISYKGRKGPFPDIDGLVISVPVVRFPKYEDDSPLVCNWKALFDGWLKEVRWPIIKEATTDIWSKMKWWRSKDDALKLHPDVRESELSASALSNEHRDKPYRAASLLRRSGAVISRPSSTVHTSPWNGQGGAQKRRNQEMDRARLTYENAAASRPNLSSSRNTDVHDSSIHSVSDSMQAPFSISESQLDAARKSYQ